jgi:hypothetical protein
MGDGGGELFKLPPLFNGGYMDDQTKEEIKMLLSNEMEAIKRFQEQSEEDDLSVFSTLKMFAEEIAQTNGLEVLASVFALYVTTRGCEVEFQNVCH